MLILLKLYSLDTGPQSQLLKACRNVSQ